MEKTEIIKMRVTPDDKAAAEAVALARGVTVSAMLRASLTRIIARAKRDSEE